MAPLLRLASHSERLKFQISTTSTIPDRGMDGIKPSGGALRLKDIPSFGRVPDYLKKLDD